MQTLHTQLAWMGELRQQLRGYQVLQKQISQQLDLVKAFQIQELVVGKNLLPLLQAGRLAAQVASTIATIPTIGYYPLSESKKAKGPAATPRTSTGRRLVSELNAVSGGRDYWTDYEDVCEEILNYCLVPPMREGLRQSRTFGGLHIRDLVFVLPYDSGEFWLWLRMKFDCAALIVECKNYSRRLRSDPIEDTATYMSAKGLGRLAVIVSRRGLSETGISAQRDRWLKSQNLILSLEDEDLLKMLEMKDRNEDPATVIDAKLTEFLLSV